jgi:hypothetical protein
MKSIHFLFAVMLLLACACNARKEQSTVTDKPDWVSLFNGENLEGWVVKIAGYELGENFGNTFRVEDGILKVRYDQYDSFDNRFGALYYDKKWTNYRLKVEYRFVGETAPGAPEWGFRDSGIQYYGQDPRTMDLDQSFPVCLEYNLHGGNGTDERPVGEICANGIKVKVDGQVSDLYCTPAQVARTFHGDQWVTAEIECRDGVFKHFVNGEEILEFTHPQYDPEHALGRQFYRENNNAVSEGYISLQSNSHPIEFSKIEILEY